MCMCICMCMCMYMYMYMHMYMYIYVGKTMISHPPNEHFYRWDLNQSQIWWFIIVLLIYIYIYIYTFIHNQWGWDNHGVIWMNLIPGYLVGNISSNGHHPVSAKVFGFFGCDNGWIYWLDII